MLEPDAPGSFCFDFAEPELLASALATGTRWPEAQRSRCEISVDTVSGALAQT